jgi:hypothetical protein
VLGADHLDASVVILRRGRRIVATETTTVSRGSWSHKHVYPVAEIAHLPPSDTLHEMSSCRVPRAVARATAIFHTQPVAGPTRAGPPRTLRAPVVLASTHERTLDVVPLEVLGEHAVDVPTTRWESLMLHARSERARIASAIILTPWRRPSCAARVRPGWQPRQP